MKQELLSIQTIIEDDIKDIVKDLIYEVERYEHKCTLSLIFSPNSLDVDLIREVARKSDIIKKMADNITLVVFTYTPLDGGIKAMEKIIFKLNSAKNNQIYSSLIECNRNSSEGILVKKLFNILDFAIDNNHKNEVLDMSYLDGIY